jgi:hypothetical protein
MQINSRKLTHICFWSSFVYESSKYSAAEYNCVLRFFKSLKIDEKKERIKVNKSYLKTLL